MSCEGGGGGADTTRVAKGTGDLVWKGPTWEQAGGWWASQGSGGRAICQTFAEGRPGWLAGWPAGWPAGRLLTFILS